MRIIYSFLTLALVLGSTLAINAYADTTTSGHEKPHEHLIGAIDKFTLLETSHRNWYKKNYANYSPDESSVKALATSLKDIQVKAFMGTWCHDSQREVPRFYKILESSNFDLNNLSLVSLNQNKITPSGLEKGLNIERTPTFIFFKDGVEIGRIVETPRDTLEKDMLKILRGQEYKHSYQD